MALLLLLLGAIASVMKRLDRLEAGLAEPTNRSVPATPSPRSNITPEMWRSYHAACKAKSKAKAQTSAKAAQKTEGGGLPPQEGASTATEMMTWLCPLCDQEMSIRAAGRGGKFYGCAAYPQCRGTRSLKDPTQASPVQEVRRRTAAAQQAAQQEAQQPAPGDQGGEGMLGGEERAR